MSTQVSPTSSPPPQSPTGGGNYTSTPPQLEGSSTSPEKKTPADFWPAVFRCMDVEPKVNFEKLAQEIGAKDAGAARMSYNRKLKKLGVDRGLGKTKPAAAKVTKAPAAAKKNDTPRKRGRPPKAKKSQKQEEGQEEKAEEA